MFTYYIAKYTNICYTAVANYVKYPNCKIPRGILFKTLNKKALSMLVTLAPTSVFAAEENISYPVMMKFTSYSL